MREAERPGGERVWVGADESGQERTRSTAGERGKTMLQHTLALLLIIITTITTIMTKMTEMTNN